MFTNEAHTFVIECNLSPISIPFMDIFYNFTKWTRVILYKKNYYFFMPELIFSYLPGGGGTTLWGI